MLVKLEDIANLRISSVLNRDAKNFGKQKLFDGDDDSCWNSEKGSPQWILIEFTKEIKITGFKLQFQGGFVGQNCKIFIKTEGSEDTFEEFYPEDNNTKQTFLLENPKLAKQITVRFESSTDFFGRVIIYNFEIDYMS